MLEPVSTFAETGDLAATRTSQKEIIDAYLLDFSKHATVRYIPNLGLVWASILVHLSQDNASLYVFFISIHRLVEESGKKNVKAAGSSLIGLTLCRGSLNTHG